MTSLLKPRGFEMVRTHSLQCTSACLVVWFMSRKFFSGGFSPGIFSGGGGGVQQIQLRTGGRENGDLGAVAP
jgi:hypothetical protein